MNIKDNLDTDGQTMSAEQIKGTQKYTVFPLHIDYFTTLKFCVTLQSEA